MVRPGRPAATAPRLARGAAQGGRARRAGCVREVPAQLAGDRQALDACGRRSSRCRGSRCRCRSGSPRCCRGAFPTTSPPGSTSSARPASSSGSAPVSTGSRSTSATTRRCSVAWSRADARGRGARPDPRGARAGSRVLVRPARRGRARGGAGAARALGSRVVGRGDERRLDAAPRRPPLRRPATGAPPAPLLAPTVVRHHGDAGPLVARRPALRGSRIAALSPSSCSSGRASSRATACAREGIVGGYSAVYGELRALETLGLCRRGYFVEGLGGAQFALGGAVERLRELRPKEGEEPERTRAGRRRSCPALRRRPAVAQARRGRAARVAGARSSSSAASRRSSSSVAAVRSSRSGSPTRSGSGRRWRRSSST